MKDEDARARRPAQLINDWPGRGLLGSFCAVFRKPPEAP
jgi:hypothetical protein